MLVKQLSGSRAGEIVDIPRHLADRLIADGRAQDVRDKSQFGDPDAINVDHRDFERCLAQRQAEQLADTKTSPDVPEVQAGKNSKRRR